MITPVTRTEPVTQRCWVCRCTDDDACWDIAHPCFWVLEDLCSACARRLLENELAKPDPMELLRLGRDPEGAA